MSNGKTWKLTVNEDELRALINHHKYNTSDTSIETSARIHDLTKRLNKDTPEIENVEAAKPEAAPAASAWG